MVVGLAVDAAWCVKSAVESLCLSVLARGSSHEGSSVKIWRFSIPGVLSFEPSREDPRDITIPNFTADVGGRPIRRTTRRCSSKRFLEVDHIVPRSKGGPNTLDNLQLLCDQHYRLKGSDLLSKLKNSGV